MSRRRLLAAVAVVAALLLLSVHMSPTVTHALVWTGVAEVAAVALLATAIVRKRPLRLRFGG